MSTSLDNMDANDSGGVGAKKGFLFQDYVAAYFVTLMLRDKRIQGVCCEVKDDIDILYSDYVEYVQIKTTDDDKKWNVDELCKRTKKKNSVRYNNDSIVHKSIQCDCSKLYKGKFRIITNRDCSSKLAYLKIEENKRVDKQKYRDLLVNSLRGYIKNFTSENGNGIDYWIDNCFWQFFQDINYLKMMSLTQIRSAAADNGFSLNPLKDEISIFNSILVKVTELSAISRKASLSIDKTYFRKDLIKWFQSQIESISLVTIRKVYSRQPKQLPQVLLHLIDCNNKKNLKTIGSGFYQSYGRTKYRFSFISKNVIKWLPEVLLRPEELSDISATSLLSSISSISCLLTENDFDLRDLLGRVLLHSILRHDSLSQPIPASLYFEKKGHLIEFDNVHIIKNDNDPDELWLGCSYLCNSDIHSAIDSAAKKISNFIEDNADLHREIILDVKSDDYLVSNDINEILNPVSSISDSLSRMQFVIFIGYCSYEQELNIKDGYEDNLKVEIESRFIEFIDRIECRYSDMLDLKFRVYIYPVPCIDTLLANFQDEINGIKNA